MRTAYNDLTEGLRLFVHSWDIFDEGANRIVEFARKSHIEFLNVAVSYHAGRFMLPHNPTKRMYTAEEGTVYFEPHPEQYSNSRIKPIRSDIYKNLDVMEVLSGAIDGTGIGINAWTVCFHNAVFASKFPELAVVDPYGSPDRNSLCPTRTENFNYVVNLISDIAENYEVSTVQLESLSFPNGVRHGYHHENFLVPINPVASFLFSTCYCSSCQNVTSDMGFDLVEIKGKAKRFIDRSLTFEENNSEVYLTDEYRELEPFLDNLFSIKNKIVTETYRKLREIIHRKFPKLKISLISNPETNRNQGINLSSIADHLDAVDYLVYFQDAKNIHDSVLKAKTDLSKKAKLVPALKMGYPFSYKEDIIQKNMRAVLDCGIDGINFYNYGWVTSEVLESLGNAIKKTL